MKSLVKTLSLAAIIAFSAVTVQSANVLINKLYYSLSGSEAKVMGDNKGLSTVTGDIVIPASVQYGGKDYEVTAIGVNAFDDNKTCKNVTSVTVPASVTKLEICGLLSLKLTKLVFEDGSEPIELVYSKGDFDYVFNDTIDYLYIGRNFTQNLSEFHGIFNLCNIKEIEFGTAVKDIPDKFICCPKQTKIVIPEGIETIGSQAFWYNMDTPVLAEVEFPSTLTSIGQGIFDCSKKGADLTLTCASKNPPTVTAANFYSDTRYMPVKRTLRIPTGTEAVYAERGWTDAIFNGGIETFEISDPESERAYLSLGQAAADTHFEVELAVEKDADLVFFLNVEEGWELKSVSLETPSENPGLQAADAGTEATAEFLPEKVDGRYQVTVRNLRNNARLVYALNETQVTGAGAAEDLTAGPRLRLIPSGFEIIGADASVTVVTPAGEIIATGRATQERPFTHTGLERGLYIIRAGARTFKVML